MRVPEYRGAVTGCMHWVNDERVWCPPMCPGQSTPRPRTGRERRRQIREWKRDGTFHPPGLGCEA